MDNFKQDSQRACNVTMRRSRATIVAMENCKYYTFRMCVCSLSYPARNAHSP